MSKNCVDATIELANDQDVPLMIIASRRQIECADFGGGYVENWSTEKFAEYVINKDKKGRVMLARDHGGPWQHPIEVKEGYSLRKAMDAAKKSYLVDIQSGMQIIHIDPSVDPNGPPALQDVLDRIFELYEYCWTIARRENRDILFEIGTEEQSGTTNQLEEIEYTLNEVQRFCGQNKLPKPTFVVLQTGTRTMETRNVGSFDAPFRIADELPAEIQVPRMLDLCKKFQIYMKEHNTDYLSDEALSWHPKLGIHAANVAPEFGVTETRAFIEVLRENGLTKITDDFIRLSYDSRKWEKWMIPNSTAGDFEKAVISGHYVFSHSVFRELKASASSALKAKGIDLDEHLKAKVKQSIFRYVKNFKLVGAA